MVDIVKEEGEILCLFLLSGHTFTFKGVVVVIDNESVLCFHYKAQSDGHSKYMRVQKSQIVGWSIEHRLNKG